MAVSRLRAPCKPLTHPLLQSSRKKMQGFGRSTHLNPICSPKREVFEDFSPRDLHPVCWAKISLIKSQSARSQNIHIPYCKWPQFPDKPPDKGKSHVFLLRKRKLECSSGKAECSSCLPLKACSHTCKSLIKHTHKLWRTVHLIKWGE